MQAFSFTNRVARLLDWRPLPFRSEWRWMSLVVMSCLALGALTAHATEHSIDHSVKGAMEIQAVREGNEDPFSLVATKIWARAPLPGRDVMAIYGQLSVRQGVITLKGVRSPQVEKVMLHETKMVEGKMSMVMRPWPQLTQDSQLELKPRGLHLMAEGLKQPLKEGEQLILQFDTVAGQTNEVSVPILSATALDYESGISE